MLYRVLKDCTFEDVTYRAGEVIDFGDPEQVTKLLAVVGDAVVVTTDAAPLKPAARPKVPAPTPEVKAPEVKMPESPKRTVRH